MVTARQEASTANQFYRSSFQTVVIILVVIVFILLAGVAVAIYLVSHRPLPQFNVYEPNGKMMRLKSYDEPNLLPSTILRWASKAAVAAYTFDFVNYNKQIAAVRPYFTSGGWSDYQASVLRLIQQISQKQLFVNSSIAGTPVISNQGETAEKGYAWHVQIPFLVTYQSADTASQQNFYVMMTIIKVSTAEDPTGIGIDQFVMR